MRRRRKKDDGWIFGVVQLVGVLILVMVIFPPIRQTVCALLGVIIMDLLVLAGLGLLVFLIFRSIKILDEPEYVHKTEYVQPLRTVDMATLETVREQPREKSPPTASQQTQLHDPAFHRPVVHCPPAPDIWTDRHQPASSNRPVHYQVGGASDLLTQLRKIDWYQFEKVVALVYRKKGYAVTRRGGANPDGGIDLIIETGGEQTAVQCKQWKTWNVGVKPVREFLGALTHAGIKRGVFVTLGGFTGDAKILADQHAIEMLTETELTKMLESVDAKYDPEVLEALNDERKFCPKCESELVLRTARKGPHPGGQFWGCKAYPRCQFKMPAS